MTNGKLLDIRINPDSKEVYLKGRDMDGIIKSETWDIRDYIKTARKYSKNLERIERQKEKYGIVDNYNYERLDELIMKKSISTRGKISSRGLDNRTDTTTKVLKRDKETGRNKIQAAGMNLEYLRDLKYQALVSPDEIMKAAGYDLRKFMKFSKSDTEMQFGRFKSMAARREYLKLLSEETKDEDNDPSSEFSEFFGFVFDNYVTEKGMTARGFFAGASEEERVELMREHLYSIGKIDLRVEDADDDEDNMESWSSVRKRVVKGKKR